MPSANKWMRKIWLAEEWPLQQVGFSKRAFEEEMGAAIKQVQRKAITLGCYLEGAESEIMGFATGMMDKDQLVILFAYTKPVYRKAGVFKTLLEGFNYDQEQGFVTSSWRFAAGNHGGRKRKLKAHFNPYIIFRLAYD